MKTILVTGGAGFIGSNLVAALCERKTHHVVVCDIFGHTEKWRNLAKHPVFEIITPTQVFDWLEVNRSQIDMIFHLGAVSSTIEKNIDLLMENNFMMSLKMWRWAAARNVRLLYSSSASVYGDGEHGFDDVLDADYMAKLNPLSGYGWCKQLFDIHVAGAHARGECPKPQWVGVRLFNVYGPNEYHKDDQRSVLSKMATQVVQSAAVKLFRSYRDDYKDGEQKRDILYVKDCVKVMLWFLDNPNVSGLFNVGTGKAQTFNAMANGLFKAVGREPSIHYFDMPEYLVSNYQYFTEANIKRLRDAGYKEEFTSLEASIDDYVKNYLTKSDHYL